MSAPNDAAARQRALDAQSSFHVQAPAGSGKTELLVQRMLALLATVEQPDAVLAITFTRKATGEMRERIAHALGPLRALPDAELEEHQRTTRRLADRLHAHAERQGWPLPDALERLQVMTLDAFHRQLAARAPLAGRLGDGIETVDGEDAAALYREATARLLERLTGSAQERQPLERVLAHFDNDIGAWQSAMTRLLGLREQWLPLIGVIRDADAAAVRERIEETLALLVEERLASARASFSDDDADRFGEIITAVGDSFAAAADSDAASALADCRALPGTDVQSLLAWRGVADLLLTTTHSIRQRFDKTVGFTPEFKVWVPAAKSLAANLATRSDLLDALIEVRHLPPIQFAEDQWSVIAALLQLLPHLVAELQVIFQERGQADYPEFARAGRLALVAGDEIGDAALALDLKIRHILIDEMQDTSVSQYTLLEQLTAGWQPGDGRTVFVVGDPMQSIYRFRQADVGRFVRLRESGLTNVRFESLQLTRNFRSERAIVEWCNEALSRVLSGTDNERTGATRFHRSDPVHERVAEAGVLVHPLVDAPLEAEAEHVAAIVAAEISAGCTDLAVLVRARRHLDAITVALAARGIAYTAVEIESLLSTRAGGRLFALTSALLHDADRLAWLSTLRQPPIGLSLAELRDLTVHEPQTCISELLRDRQRLESLPVDRRRYVQRFLKVVDDARRHSRASLAERVERVWLELDGPAWLIDDNDRLQAEAFFATLRDHVEPGSWPDPAVLAERIGDVRVSRFGSDEPRVQLMTMHKAKGLEFDTVIVPGLGRRSARADTPPLAWSQIDPDTPEALLLALQGTRASEQRDAHHAYLGWIEKQQEDNERRRLLYVACTRARERLHLVAATTLTRTRQPPAGSPLHALWDSVADQVLDAADASPAWPEASVDTGVVPATQRSKGPQRLTVVSRLPGAEPPAVGGAEVAVEYNWASDSARVVGTLVHRWLEQFVKFPDAAAARRWFVGHRAQLERELRSRGLRDSALDAALRRCEQALSAVLDDDRGQWILFGPHRQAAAELELSGFENGRVRTIVIDRVFETKDGEHWIVDYKTSAHEGGALAAFMAEEANRYRDQLTAYHGLYHALTGVSARTALYYPLLGEWLEVSV
ncbi:MAG: UvrD-helicase domain-containing protein [Pseudomonadota bacterium]